MRSWFLILAALAAITAIGIWMPDYVDCPYGSVSAGGAAMCR